MNYANIIEEKYADAVSGMRDKWLTKTDNKWYDYVIKLPLELKVTYLVVVFHNQIFNGGFDQYFVNGYGQFATETINALRRINAFYKADLLEKAYKSINIGYSDIVFRKKILNKDIPYLYDDDNLLEYLGQLDEEYYENKKEDIKQLLGEYLLNTKELDGGGVRSNSMDKI